MHLEYAIVGLVAGCLVGLTGMGGGAIVTPLLLYFGIPPVTAIGTDLAYGALTKLFGVAPHIRGGSADLRVVRHLAYGSVPGSLFGVLLLHRIRVADSAAADRFIERAVGVVLVSVAAITLVYLIRGQKAADGPPRIPPKPLLIGAGAVVGCIVGISSIGSGTLLMAVLLPLWSAPGLTLVGTDIIHGALLTSTAAIGHAFTGDIDLRLLANLLIGSIPGITLGTMVARRVSTRALKGVFAVLLFTVGVRLL